MTGDERAAVVAEALGQDVERGVECYHGSPRACLSFRCGSNCSLRFDRMHPCPACLIAEIRDLRDAVTALGGDPYNLDAQPGDAEQAGDWRDKPHTHGGTDCGGDARCPARTAAAPGADAVRALDEVERRVTENDQEFLMRTLTKRQWDVVAKCLRAEVEAAVREVRAAADTGGERGAGR